MTPSTRRRMQEVVAYCESVTKLTASELLEGGTQCPVCWKEIVSFASIYLHRACANVVCSSCFECSLSQRLNSGICLICKGYLAEACIENAVPNWHFTYTDIPLPGYSINPPFPDSRPPGATGNGILSSDNKFTAGEGVRDLSATIEKLEADLEKQREMMNELKDEQCPSREKNSRFQRRRRPFSWQGSLDAQYENRRKPRYDNNTNSEAQGNTFDLSTRNQYSSNLQNNNSSNSGPRLHLYSHNEQKGSPQHSNEHNRQGANPTDLRNRAKPSLRKQDHKPHRYNGEGLDPALARQHKYLYNRKQDNSGNWWQPSLNAYEPSIFKKNNPRRAPGNGRKSCRAKMRTWNGADPSPNINQDLKHAQSFPSESFQVEMDSVE